MKKIRNLLFLASLVPLLIVTSSYKSEVSYRGGDVRGGYDRGFRGNVNYGNYPDNRYGDYGRYGGYGGYYGDYGGGVVYPYGYPVGGYLLPGPVNPGEDEADAIYRSNLHPPQ